MNYLFLWNASTGKRQRRKEKWEMPFPVLILALSSSPISHLLKKLWAVCRVGNKTIMKESEKSKSLPHRGDGLFFKEKKPNCSRITSVRDVPLVAETFT